MSYITDFPHTRTYDSDLGFLIKEFEELNNEYIELMNIYNDIYNDITQIVNDALKDGKIFLETDYNSETKTLSFVFKQL